jgi:hypothetical protein
MDLETFIAETLRQIIKGVKTAQASDDCKGAQINPTYNWHGTQFSGAQKIEFDVAVTVSEEKAKQGKANIGVASYIGIGGKASSATASSSVSRIRFEVPVTLPTKEKR